MYCIHCGTKLQDHAQFCSNCGKKVERVEESSPIQEKNTSSIQEVWHPSVSKKPVPSLKTVSFKEIKVPIIAVAIVVILIVTFVLFSSSDDDQKETVKDLDSVSAETTIASEKTTSKNLDKRYDSDGFFFNHEEFAELYNDVLTEKNSPLSVGKSVYGLENGKQWDLLFNNKPAVYFNTTEDPTTGRITTVKAGHNGLTAGYEAITEEEYEAILYIIEACHGPLTDEQWNEIRNPMATLNTDTIKIYDLNIDDLSIKITITQTTFSIDIYAGVPQTSAEKTTIPVENTSEPDVDPNVIAKFPYGKKRFDSTFLFTHKEFADLYNLVLMANKPNFSLGNPSDVGNGKYNYPFKYQGEKVGFIIVQVNNAGKVTNIAIDYDFDLDKDVAQEGISACLFILKAAHGDMSDADWTSVFETAPTTVRDTYSIFSYDLSGMSASMLLYNDRLHLNMEVE